VKATIIVLLMFFCLSLTAQDAESQRTERAVFLKSGERLNGFVLERTKETIILKVGEKRKRIALRDIKAELSVETADSLISMISTLGDDYEWFVLERLNFAIILPKDSDWRKRTENLASYFKYLEKLFTPAFLREPLIVIAKPDDSQTKLGLTHYGYYDDATLRILIRSDSGDTVLKHESVHLYHLEYAKKNGLPQALWVIEGLATLFENASLESGTVKPPPANRAEEARRLYCFNALPKLTDFLAQDFSAFYQNPAENYSLASCFLNFIYKKDCLEKFLQEYYVTCKDDKSGVKALEKVFGKTINAIETDFYGFLSTLPRVPDLPPAGAPFLGIETQESDKRVHIVKVIRNSPANKAGLKPNDILVSLGGVYVKTLGNLKTALASYKSGDKLKLVFLRDGSIFEGDVTLEAVRD